MGWPRVAGIKQDHDTGDETGHIKRQEGVMTGIELAIETTRTTGMVNITSEIQSRLTEHHMKNGAVLIFVPHTTAGITINEGADPSVKADIESTLNEIVPWERVYGHAEGNSPAHIKTSLVGNSVMVIVEDGRIKLGQWQSIFLCEFDGPRHRRIWVKPILSMD
jgi:secondary thiamine-phosphate synthase enzyme